MAQPTNINNPKTLIPTPQPKTSSPASPLHLTNLTTTNNLPKSNHNLIKMYTLILDVKLNKIKIIENIDLV